MFKVINMFEDVIVKILKNKIKVDAEKIRSVLEVPPDPELGDIAFPCFILSKELKKNPNQIAKELEQEIKPTGVIERVQACGPYLNFYFNNKKISEVILKEVLKKKEEYGKGKKNNKIVVVEFPAPNTNKPLHLGHLRNMALGESVSRIYEFLGYTVKRVNLYNDRGIHICKSMLAYKKWGNNKKPNKKPDHFVGDYYVLFARKAKNNPKLLEEAQELLRKWEKGDNKVRALWKKMNDWAYKGFNETFKKFGLKKYDKNYYESKIYTKGKKIILEGLKRGLFEKDETGAVIVDLDKLGKKILLRSDGTSVYITQDIYLAKKKFDDFKFDKSIYVVGNEQIHHFKVLFKVLDLLGFKFAKNCYHLSYGMIELPEGKMKSREGKVVDADDLIDKMIELAEKEIRKRGVIKDEEEIKSASERIGVGALKYYLLSYSASKNFVFNPEKSISFEGETGPYLMYSLVRAKKIIKKSKKRIDYKNIDFKLLNSKEEVSLIKKLGEFPEIVEKASKTYSPHILCEYGFNIANLFNSFYENKPVLNASDENTKNARLMLVTTYIHVLTSCLTLLGIKTVKEM